ncbi:unnamed protein product [Protopolystoma xenopodis]|uniref:Striatin N-terminal domain-containing protein n=1 Tax=Protopolystoma xenopodis TaxID=117903 RepID=A0A448WKR7_9PLAT|nr:unnamed protein product [Protopolystoma xenopodis]
MIMDDDCSGDEFIGSYNKSNEKYITPRSFQDSKPVQYTLPDILHYLQSEWSKMEIERSQWEVERAEMQARIAFLQGELKCQENLKTDLVRRIKMLEYAVVQERNKTFKMKNTVDNHNSGVNTHLDEDVSNNLERNKEERAFLRRYLGQIGISKQISEARQVSVRELLGISAPNILSRPKSDSKELSSVSADRNSLHSALASFGFLGEEESGELINPSNPSAEDVIPLSKESEYAIQDVNTSEALAEFDFIVSQHFDVPISKPSNDSSDANEDHQPLLSRLKEQYQYSKPLHNTGGSISLNTWLSEPLSPLSSALNLPNNSELRLFSGGSLTDTCIPNSQALSSADFDLVVDEQPAPTTGRQLIILNRGNGVSASSIARSVGSTGTMSSAESSASDGGASNGLGLGDLAGLTVANESDITSRGSACINNNNESMSPSTPVTMDSLDGVPPPGFIPVLSSIESVSGSLLDTDLKSRLVTNTIATSWVAKYTLRSHFDAIRCAVFHPTEQILLTASEDHTLKMWNLAKTVQAKKTTSLDVEPMYTFRGHTSPVLSLVVSLYRSSASSASASIDDPVNPNRSFASSSGGLDANPNVPSALGAVDVASSLSLSEPTTATVISASTSTIDGEVSEAEDGNPLVVAFSGSMDGEIRAWKLPDARKDPYDVFDSSIHGPVLKGHNDAVWSLSAAVVFPAL